MADLSAVLRKTIDGLPRATPSMRAKVYEKARAAIARQIEAASPPLAGEVVEARRQALENAIRDTENHYASLAAAAAADSSTGDADPAAAAPAAAPRAPPPPLVSPQVEAPAPRFPAPASTPPRSLERARVEPSLGEDRPAPPVLPIGIEPRNGPDAVEAPFPTADAAGRARREPSPLDTPRVAATEPSGGLDEGAIPAADLAAPRKPNGARRAEAGRRRSAVLAGLAILVCAGAGTAAFLYLDEIRSALDIDGGSKVASTTVPPAATPAATPPESAGTEDGEDADASDEPEETDVAAVPSEPAAAPAEVPKRRFTQRLMPDGTEVDTGPAQVVANAFDEGTNVAAASPPTAAAQPSAMSPSPAPATPTTTPPTQAPATPGTAAPATGTATPPAQTAAVQPTTPPAAATTPAVAQKAVFYEERSETEAGTQRAGNVVWSVVNEPPADGQPAEPAIRAVADVPEENLRLTLTIRRNTDATLPASHVIELMFDTPADFAGGSIANVQRLALKPTEQARGEPLIGVAGKISDGFFIIALNNLSEAATTNIDLLSREQWIDIPIAYATGRRALMSIEKGIPGDRAFKEAIDAWAGKT